MKVDFFIVGAPKSGTTSLYKYLDGHKEIEMSAIKEPDFFSKESIENFGSYYTSKCVKDVKAYHALFEKKDLLNGEASVSYLFFEDVASKIKQYNNDAKIIIMLRNPVDRAFSHYLMDYRLGLVNTKFEDIVLNHSNKDSLFYKQYIEVGKYSNQVKRYVKTFGLKNIHIINYEDFNCSVENEFEKVLSFLNINKSTLGHLNIKHNTFLEPKNKIIKYIYKINFIRTNISRFLSPNIASMTKKIFFKKESKPILKDSTRKTLTELFRSDIESLSRITKNDFSKWIK